MTAKTRAIEERVIRVFVSSTFRDMSTERDVLIKRVFPEIRSLCDERGVTFSEVDLRWGVTNEQAAEGRVLPICLEEIKNCRPYFIGLLGERYGWVPDELTDDLLEREPWLASYQGRSVTELEILHGVLRSPAMADHAFFYLRDPGFVAGVELARRSDFEEVGDDLVGERAAADRRAKLATLKERIRGSEFPVRDFASPEELGEQIRADFVRLIDGLYPAGSAQDPLAAETLQHEALARSRAAVYVERPAYFEALDGFVAAGDREAVAVVGESGHGKSALLASWALHHRAEHPEDLVIMHFIGSSPLSADPDDMLRRLVGELAASTGLAEDPDATDTAALRREFARLLYAAGDRGRVILVLDALNQLVDRDGAHELVWLPPVLPEGVHVIVSTLPSLTQDALGRRGWLDDALHVTGLEPAERATLIERYLARYTKSLDPALIDRIASHPQSASPLYLRALLDELRIWGEHETLDARLGELLDTQTVDDLFEVILTRYETDYQPDSGTARPGLVGEAMSLLWAARHGLTEAELLELLGTDTDPLPHAAWAPLHYAAGEILNERAGLLTFAHDFFRRAVEDRYLHTQDAKRDAHRRIAAYMLARGPVLRSLQEAPWQLAEAEDWERLVDVLSDKCWFTSLCEADHREALALWVRVERSSPLRARATFELPEGEDEITLKFVGAVSILMMQLSEHGEALLFLDHARLLASRGRTEQERTTARNAVLNQAWIHNSRGDPDRAAELFAQFAKMCMETGDRWGLGGAYTGQAVIYSLRGQLDKAMEFFRAAERIAAELGDHDGLQGAYGNQGVIEKRRGRFDQALEFHERQERICRESGNGSDLATALLNEAEIHGIRGDEGAALDLLSESQKLATALGQKSTLSLVLCQQASIHRKRDDLDRALEFALEASELAGEFGELRAAGKALWLVGEIREDRQEFDLAMTSYAEAERIARGLGAPADVARSLAGQARVLEQRGEVARALELLLEEQQVCSGSDLKDFLAISLREEGRIREQRGESLEACDRYAEEERLWAEVGDAPMVRMALGRQARLQRKCGNLDRALELQHIEAQISRCLRDPTALRDSLHARARIHDERSEFDRALEAHREAEDLSRTLGDHSMVATSLWFQARTHFDRREYDEALRLLLEEERICRDLGDRDALSGSLALQAHVHRDRRDLDRALELELEVERISEELNDHEAREQSLETQALIHQDRGDFDRALELYREQEGICRETGNQAGLQASLGNQANIHADHGELDRAMELHLEKERICRELGDLASLLVSLGNQANVHADRGELDRAMELHLEEERICRDLGDLASLQVSLGNQANVHADRGELDRAMELHREKERICREVGNLAGLQMSLGNQALIHKQRGALDEAMELQLEREQTCRSMENPGHLLSALGDQAMLCLDRSDAPRAFALLEEHEAICRRLGGREESMAWSLALLGFLRRASGDRATGDENLEEASAIARDSGNLEFMATVEKLNAIEVGAAE